LFLTSIEQVVAESETEQSTAAQAHLLRSLIRLTQQIAIDGDRGFHGTYSLYHWYEEEEYP
jgi:hypothetical protein